MESVAAQAAGLREESMLDLVSHDREAARTHPDWTPVLLLRNPAPRTRSGVAIVEVATKLADVPVGPGSARAENIAAARRTTRGAQPRLGLGGGQLLGTSTGFELTESPRSYPDNDLVERVTAAIWVENAPAYGITALPIARSPARSPAGPPKQLAVALRGSTLSNGRLRIAWSADGEITLTDGARTIGPLIAWESRRDAGDLYTPSLRGRKLRASVERTRVVHRGPLRGEVEQIVRLAGGSERVDLRLRYILDAGASWLRLHVSGENAARDHRLRLVLRHGIRSTTCFADAAFGAVERRPPEVPARSARMETPVTTAPLHRYVSVFDDKRSAGATMFSDGLTEYESVPGAFAVTLLRSVGELSRADIPERPGHAGWPAATPEAQCIGRFDAGLALMLHGARTETLIDEIERTADDVLFPITGSTLRSALAVPQPFHGIALEGAGLAFSCIKESEEDDWVVLRCVNLLDRECAGAWRLGAAAREAQLARLDETPLAPLQAAGDRVPFLAPPRATVTILVR
jgi:hypothetical protein